MQTPEMNDFTDKQLTSFVTAITPDKEPRCKLVKFVKKTWALLALT